MWWILGVVALVATVVALARWRLARRAEQPAWDSLTHEEQGIVARNSQPGTYGSHEVTKAQSYGPSSSGTEIGGLL